MIKNPPGLELQKSVANGFTDPNRKLACTKQQEGQFHKLLASPKSKNSGSDLTVQKRTDESNDTRGIRASSSNRGDEREKPSECAAGDYVKPASTAPPVPNSREEPNSALGALQSAFMQTMKKNVPSTDLEPGIRQYNPVPTKHLWEIQTQPLAQATTGPIGRKQGEHSLKPELETSIQNSGRQQHHGIRAVSELRASAGIESTAQLQSANSTTSGTLADSKVPVTLVSDLVISGLAAPNAGKTDFSTKADIRSVRDITKFHDIDARFAAKSKAILVQMDFPELGKITARFGGLSEAISLTLTANDEDMSPAVAEVQREMKIWLEHANVEAIESAQIADARLDDPKGFQKNSPEQENKSKGQAFGTVPDALNSEVDHGDPTENDFHPIGQSARKWRLI